MIAGLKNAIQDTSLFLEELNLSDNQLTATSLRSLASVISLSSGHLKDLDLSDNQICLRTDEDAEAWEMFVKSFGSCRGMRRLVLSGNDLSNGLAIEILAREYGRQGLVDDVEKIVETPGRHLTTHDENANADQASQRRTPSRSRKPSLRAANMSISVDAILQDGQYHAPKSTGLCSIPYIILSNVKMNETGALWLSYVLENHDTPAQLMPSPVKAGPMAALLEEYREKKKCEGLVYRPNENLSALGWKILSAAERSRKRKLRALDSSAVNLEDSDFDEEDGARLSELSRCVRA
jgi:hypothetical protein